MSDLTVAMEAVRRLYPDAWCAEHSGVFWISKTTRFQLRTEAIGEGTSRLEAWEDAFARLPAGCRHCGYRNGHARLCFGTQPEFSVAEVQTGAVQELPPLDDSNEMDVANSSAAKEAAKYYKPHRFGDGPAWFAAAHRLAYRALQREDQLRAALVRESAALEEVRRLKEENADLAGSGDKEDSPSLAAYLVRDFGYSLVDARQKEQEMMQKFFGGNQ